MAEDDIPIDALRRAASSVRSLAKARAGAHGGTLTFVVNGRMVVEHADGRREDVGESRATTVHLTQRVWKIR